MEPTLHEPPAATEHDVHLWCEVSHHVGRILG